MPPETVIEKDIEARSGPGPGEGSPEAAVVAAQSTPAPVRDTVPDITTVATTPSSSYEETSRDSGSDNDRDRDDSDDNRRDATLARHEETAEGVDPTKTTAIAAVDNKMNSDNEATHQLLVVEQESIRDQAAAEFVEAVETGGQVSDMAEPAKKYLQAQAAVNQLKNPGAEEERILVQLAEESSETAGIAFPYRAAGYIPGLEVSAGTSFESGSSGLLNSEVLQQLVPGTIGNVMLLKVSEYIGDVVLAKVPPTVQVLGQIVSGAYTGRLTAPAIREVTDAGFEAAGGEIAREMPGIGETFTSENLAGQLLVDSLVSTTVGMTASTAVKALGLSVLGLSSGPVGWTALAVGSYSASKGFVWADNTQDQLWDDISRTTAENIGADLGISVDDESLPLTDAEEAELVMFYHRQQPSISSDRSPVESESPVLTEEMPETVEVASYQPATPADTDSATTDETPMSDDVMALINLWLSGADPDDGPVVFADSKDNDDHLFVPAPSQDCDVTGSQGMALLEDLMEGRIQFDDAPPEVQFAFDSIQDARIDLVDADGELLLSLADLYVQKLVDSGELSEHGQFCVEASDPEPVVDIFAFYDIA